MAFLSASDGQYEYAAQLLSAAMHHPANPAGGWLDQWPPVGRLRADLLENLGSRDYARAWERGKSLDLETVVRDLLEEFRKAGGP
jgi:hypothetical protein